MTCHHFASSSILDRVFLWLMILASTLFLLSVMSGSDDDNNQNTTSISWQTFVHDYLSKGEVRNLGCLSVHLSVGRSVCLSVGLPACRSVCLSVIVPCCLFACYAIVSVGNGGDSHEPQLASYGKHLFLIFVTKEK